MFYCEKLLRELYRAKVPYLVVGGMAVNLHGYDRSTGDLDIMVSLKTADVKRLVKAIKVIGFKPRLPVSLDDFADPKKRRVWIEEKNMLVFSVYNPALEFEHVDILIADDINFNQAYDRREDIKAGDTVISVVSIPDLIRMKKKAGRKTDKIDIEALEAIARIRRHASKNRN
ncbi:MAG: hypothetical protein HQL20_02770 [Candidatus Omnitrophica bacterium]|nr:hypothetical protein [Candidatus Omnitrophota bacterium]